MRPSRFERKILVAIAVVALGSSLGAVAVGAAAVRDAYEAGVNPALRATLEEGVAARREHLLALRQAIRGTADAIAYHHLLHDALRDDDRSAAERYLEAALAAHPETRSITVHRDGDVFAERSADGLGEDVRSVGERRTLRDLDASPTVAIVLVAPRAPFDAFQRAGEQADLYARLEAATDYVSSVYLWVYLAFVSVLTAVSVAVGAMLSRRATLRVNVLAEATKRVGAGDLTVTVPISGDDEVRELTESFNEMVRDLRQSRARIDYLKRIGAWQDFARRLAHEIKNPLTPIQLAAQEMHRGYTGKDPEYRRKLEDAASMIEEEVATLRRLVGEFSAFARLPTARLEEADVADFLRDVERGIPAMLEDFEAKELPRVDVRFIYPPEPLPARLDAMMLRRGIDNLVRNAVQASAELHSDGGGKVVVEAARLGELAQIEVRDNGPGIPLDDVERIFDPYYTTKSEGTGLGLPIVKKVVLEHGGAVDCVPNEESGAVFSVRLPLAR
jgi:two-component system, NtrC family, nitrogen regulation sensor histidine kinase NtrY